MSEENAMLLSVLKVLAWVFTPSQNEMGVKSKDDTRKSKAKH